jgi:hypothetical protein
MGLLLIIMIAAVIGGFLKQLALKMLSLPDIKSTDRRNSGKKTKAPVIKLDFEHAKIRA